MVRNVFLSILGTGWYNECTYVKDDFKCRTKYIQEATIEYLTSKVGIAFDKIFVFYTKDGAPDENGRIREGSKTSNWDKELTERYNSREKIDEPYIRLEKILLDKRICPPVLEGCFIADGNTEQEQWDIFNTIFGKLNDGDQLYIDITHSFRSLPMLLLVLCNYAKFLKGISIKSITYGNYEARKKK